jgi:hypothetical protein
MGEERKEGKPEGRRAPSRGVDGEDESRMYLREIEWGEEGGVDLVGSG